MGMKIVKYIIDAFILAVSFIFWDATLSNSTHWLITTIKFIDGQIIMFCFLHLISEFNIYFNKHTK